jgi:hypothetical protein
MTTPAPPVGFGEPQGGAPMGREGFGEPQGGAPIHQSDDPRIIPVSKDEEQWPGLLEVGGEIIARGGLVVLPTDTLYGVGCDPCWRRPG